MSVVHRKNVSRILKQYNIASAMKPQSTLRGQLVHPKDKRYDLEITKALYREYISEAGRKFETRLYTKERKVEVDKVRDYQSREKGVTFHDT